MLRNAKLGTRIFIGFSAVAIIVLILGGIGFYGAAKNDETIHTTGDVLLPKVQSLLQVAQQMERASAVMRTLAVPGLSADERERQYANLSRAREAYRDAREEYRSYPRSDEEASLWERYDSA